MLYYLTDTPLCLEQNTLLLLIWHSTQFSCLLPPRGTGRWTSKPDWRVQIPVGRWCVRWRRSSCSGWGTWTAKSGSSFPSWAACGSRIAAPSPTSVHLPGDEPAASVTPATHTTVLHMCKLFFTTYPHTYSRATLRLEPQLDQKSFQKRRGLLETTG